MHRINIHLRLAQTIIVRDVKSISCCSCVHAPCASFLQPQVVQYFGETWVL